MNLIHDLVIQICTLSLLALSVRIKTKTALNIPKINNVLNFLKLCYFLENIELVLHRRMQNFSKGETLLPFNYPSPVGGMGGEFERGQSYFQAFPQKC